MFVARWLAPTLLLAFSATTTAAPRDYIILLNIPFVSGSDQLGPLALARLERALPRLKADYGDVAIEIAGHSDNYGRAANNQELSERRARTVFGYLQSNGVDVKFMFERGYGSTEPIADNESRSGRFRNRRVELRRLRGLGPGDLSLH